MHCAIGARPGIAVAPCNSRHSWNEPKATGNSVNVPCYGHICSLQRRAKFPANVTGNWLRKPQKRLSISERNGPEFFCKCRISLFLARQNAEIGSCMTASTTIPHRPNLRSVTPCKFLRHFRRLPRCWRLCFRDYPPSPPIFPNSAARISASPNFGQRNDAAGGVASRVPGTRPHRHPPAWADVHLWVRRHLRCQRQHALLRSR